jgi:phosphoribosylanthranilate isomerase
MTTKNLKIKICGMVRPHNIRDIDKINPDYLGFIFYPKSPRNMDNNAEALPETKAKRVGVFVNSDIENIIKKARYFKLNTIQLHGNETPETCRELKELGYEVFKAFQVNDNTPIHEIIPYQNKCDVFLYDTQTEQHGGSGKKFNWQKLEELASIGSFMLSGGIGPEDAEAIKALNYPNLIGVDLNSRFEIEPGVKIAAALEKFIKQIKS